ncbi:MAG: nucleoside-triphosphatase [Candidatus Thalassarchaeaceae archaeon]|jgi:nucleoside-triphosphatase|nr:nucleoside-triphosphatase [Candidatus Thalassarchaeaceae archaeon]
MGIHPKIGVTGLPRSGKNAVMKKVVEMLENERGQELRGRGEDPSSFQIIGGMKTIPILEGTTRVGYSCQNIQSGETGTFAHKEIDSRNRILGLGIDPDVITEVAVPAIQDAIDNYEVIVIDEIGKFSVESEEFVAIVREVIDIDKPTIMTLHKKSRHPLLQDIRRRDDSRILEVTPVNRALLPYKIHKIIRETF